jgi:hypothetical protein
LGEVTTSRWILLLEFKEGFGGEDFFEIEGW